MRRYVLQTYRKQRRSHDFSIVCFEAFGHSRGIISVMAGPWWITAISVISLRWLWLLLSAFFYSSIQFELHTSDFDQVESWWSQYPRNSPLHAGANAADCCIFAQKLASERDFHQYCASVKCLNRFSIHIKTFSLNESLHLWSGKFEHGKDVAIDVWCILRTNVEDFIYTWVAEKSWQVKSPDIW